VRIRLADPDRDAAACAAIYLPFVTESATSFDEEPPTAAYFADKINHLRETYPFLVATEGDEVIGYAYASEYRERVAYRWSAEVSVYIHANHRGKGLGKRLYEVLLELMTKQGFRVAVAAITVPNHASIALHKSCGFEDVGVFNAIGFKLGAWRDVAFLSLQLGGGEPPAAPPGPPVLLVDEQ
jgi:L-amino acid N-acyltransferase YncA